LGFPWKTQRLKPIATGFKRFAHLTTGYQAVPRTKLYQGQSCTKDKAQDPLGVCSVFEAGRAIITCPVRFREAWLVASDAASFLFKPGTKWTSLTEVRLSDADGASAGNIDVVLVAYDPATGQLTDFGSIEIQAVYISGNIRLPFQAFVAQPDDYRSKSWQGGSTARPDYLSSSRKRLVPQILYKGTILHSWGKRQVIALQESFFDTLPSMPQVEPDKAEVAWMLYDLKPPEDLSLGQRGLYQTRVIYTKFDAALLAITKPHVGQREDFEGFLQRRLDAQLANRPDTSALLDVITED
jgi:hypothetical protein